MLEQYRSGKFGLTFLLSSCRFSVNKRIFVVGFGLYGSIHGPTDYQVNIQVILSAALKILAVLGADKHILVNLTKPEVQRDSVCVPGQGAGRCSKGQMGHWRSEGLLLLILLHTSLQHLPRSAPSFGAVGRQFGKQLCMISHPKQARGGSVVSSPS